MKSLPKLFYPDVWDAFDDSTRPSLYDWIAAAYYLDTLTGKDLPKIAAELLEEHDDLGLGALAGESNPHIRHDAKPLLNFLASQGSSISSPNSAASTLTRQISLAVERGQIEITTGARAIVDLWYDRDIPNHYLDECLVIPQVVKEIWEDLDWAYEMYYARHSKYIPDSAYAEDKELVTNLGKKFRVLLDSYDDAS